MCGVANNERMKMIGLRRRIKVMPCDTYLLSWCEQEE